MKIPFKYLLVFMLVLPGVVPAQTNASSDTINIFTLGDSNGSFPYSWPSQLQSALPNVKVFNISRGGKTIGFVNNGDSTLNSLHTIDENLRKATDFIRGRHFDFIVLQLGTNDAKAVFARRQMEVPTNLQKLITTIKNSNDPSINKAKIIIVSPPPYGTKAEATEKYKGGGARVKAMSKAFEKIARRNGCLFVNGFETPGLDIEAMTDDGLHLDSTGSKKLIEPVVKLLEKGVF